MAAETPLDQTGSVRLLRPPDPVGKLQVHTSVVDGRVIADFGRAIWWVGFTPEEADKLGNDLINAARSARMLHVPPSALED